MDILLQQGAGGEVRGAQAWGGHGGRKAALAMPEPLAGRGLRVALALSSGPGVPCGPPACCLKGRDLGFWEPCENQPASLDLSFPLLRKGVGCNDFKGILEAKITMACVPPQASFLV